VDGLIFEFSDHDLGFETPPRETKRRRSRMWMPEGQDSESTTTPEVSSSDTAGNSKPAGEDKPLYGLEGGVEGPPPRNEKAEMKNKNQRETPQTGNQEPDSQTGATKRKRTG